LSSRPNDGGHEAGRWRRLVSYANYQLWIFVVGGALLAVVMRLAPPEPRPEVQVAGDHARLALDPEFAEGHLRLGEVAANTGDWSQARTHFEDAFAADPWSAHALFGLARVAQAEGDLESALDLLEQARTLAPRFPEVYQFTASILSELGRHEEAYEALEEAHDISRSEQLLLPLAAAAARIDRLPATRSYLAAASRAAGAEATAQVEIARTAIASRLPQASESALERALAVEPERAEALGLMALALVSQRRFDEARAYVDRALELDPDLVEALFAKGLVLVELGQDQEAREVWRRVLTLAPDHRGARARLAESGGP
jgi:tetratricopeptide (TPR) repeat protein